MKKALLLIVFGCITIQILAQSGAKWSVNGNAISNGDFLGTTNALPLDFKTNNSSRMSIDINGKVSINNLSGIGNRFIQVTSNGELISFQNGNPNEVLYGNGTWGILPQSALVWGINGNNIFSANSGSVGIGTNTPNYKLDVAGDAHVSNNLYVGSGIITTGTVNSNGEINGGDLHITSNMLIGGNSELTGSLKISSLAGAGGAQLYVDQNGFVYKQEPTINWSCWPSTYNWNPGGNTFSALQNVFNPPPPEIGTCDNYDFILKSFNVNRQWIKTDGTIGFGTNIASNTGGPEYRFKTGVIRLQNQNTYGGPQIIFDLDDNSTPYGDWGIEYTKSLPGKDGLNFWKPFGSTNSNNAFMLIADDGMIGIGTDNPSTKLTIDAWNNDGLKILTDPNKLVINVFNKTTNKSEFLVKSNGFVYAREINVLPTNLTFPDYVFSSDYKLIDLNQVEAYIKSNKHLPNIPSAKDVEKNGINLAEMQVKQIEKIEELFLYIIELKKENEDLKGRIEKLEKK